MRNADAQRGIYCGLISVRQRPVFYLPAERTELTFSTEATLGLSYTDL